MFIKIEQFHKAIEDCETAIKINPNWVKAHMRKAVALMELTKEPDSATQAIATFKHALKIAQDDDQDIIDEMEGMLQFLKKEREQDTALPMDHPERTRYNTLLKWME